MRELFLKLDYTNDDDLRDKLSAEIHSLVRSEIDAGDRVVLFQSDTADGELCARLVRDYLVERMGLKNDNVRIERIVGLQVDKALRFQREGVPTYFQIAIHEIEQWGAENCVINPTGGFKALVSYATLLGMMFGVDVCYMFDNGAELIKLPPLPVNIDTVRLLPLLPAMEEIERKTAIKETTFWGNAPYEDRQKYEMLLESDGPNVTLSAIGHLVYERLKVLREETPLTVYLSLAAWDDFRTAPAVWNLDGFYGHLKTVRDVSPLIHITEASGQKWLKPGNTADRHLVETDGNRLLVYRIIGHDEYERRSIGKPYARADFAPFTRFDYVE